MRGSVIIFLLVSQKFCLRGEGVQITATHTSRPVTQTSATVNASSQPPLPTLTLNCTTWGTSHIRSITSLKITSHSPHTDGAGHDKEEVVGILSSAQAEESGEWSAGSCTRSCDQVVNKAGVLSTKDPVQSFLSLEVAMDLCSSKDARVYTCHMDYYDDEDGNRLDNASVVESGIVPLGPLMVATQPPTDPSRKAVEVPVSSQLQLDCRGWLGSEPISGVGIVWQWAAVDSGPDTHPPAPGSLTFTEFVPQYQWDQVLNTTVTRKPLAGGDDSEADDQCVRYMVQSTVVRVVTETDRFRTYRCVPSLTNGQLLDHLAASVLVVTQLPQIKIKTHPSRLRFFGNEIVLPNIPLQIQCLEIHRPMEPPADVRIRLIHRNKVIASVCGDMVHHCKGRDSGSENTRTSENMYNTPEDHAGQVDNGVRDDLNDTRSSTAETDKHPTNTTKNKVSSNSYSTTPHSNHETSIESPQSTTDRQTPEAEEGWKQDIRYNADVTSQHMLFVCLTTYTISCHSGGTYHCVFDYLMEVDGARPIVLTQETVVLLPFEVSPQKPHMTVSKDLLQYPTGAKIRVTCTAFMGGPILSADWKWQICHYANCTSASSFCFFKSCHMMHQVKKTRAEFHEDKCQYKQSSSIDFTFSDDGYNITEIRCYVTRLNASYWPAVSNFTKANERKHKGSQEPSHAAKSTLSGAHGYQNLITAVLLPVVLAVSAVIVVCIVFAIARRRYQRMQRRFRAHNRKSTSRTDHFRKRPRGVPRRREDKENAWTARKKSALTFCRATLTVLEDMTEEDIEEEEKRVYRERSVRSAPACRRKSCTAFRCPRASSLPTSVRYPTLLFSMSGRSPRRRRATSLPVTMGRLGPSASRAEEDLVPSSRDADHHEYRY